MESDKKKCYTLGRWICTCFGWKQFDFASKRHTNKLEYNDNVCDFCSLLILVVHVCLCFTSRICFFRKYLHRIFFFDFFSATKAGLSSLWRRKQKIVKIKITIITQCTTFITDKCYSVLSKKYILIDIDATAYWLCYSAQIFLSKFCYLNDYNTTTTKREIVHDMWTCDQKQNWN